MTQDPEDKDETAAYERAKDDPGPIGMTDAAKGFPTKDGWFVRWRRRRAEERAVREPRYAGGQKTPINAPPIPRVSRPPRSSQARVQISVDTTKAQESLKAAADSVKSFSEAAATLQRQSAYMDDRERILETISALAYYVVSAGGSPEKQRPVAWALDILETQGRSTKNITDLLPVATPRDEIPLLSFRCWSKFMPPDEDHPRVATCRLRSGHEGLHQEMNGPTVGAYAWSDDSYGAVRADTPMSERGKPKPRPEPIFIPEASGPPIPQCCLRCQRNERRVDALVASLTRDGLVAVE